jgi:RNA polymerase-binding transcription factor DksA
MAQSIRKPAPSRGRPAPIQKTTRSAAARAVPGKTAPVKAAPAKAASGKSAPARSVPAKKNGSSGSAPGKPVTGKSVTGKATGGKGTSTTAHPAKKASLANGIAKKTAAKKTPLAAAKSTPGGKPAKGVPPKAAPARKVVTTKPVATAPRVSPKTSSRKSSAPAVSPGSAKPVVEKQVAPKKAAAFLVKPVKSVSPAPGLSRGRSIPPHEKGSLDNNVSPASSDISLAFQSAPNLLEENIFDPGLLRNDEVYDETDQAQHLQLMEQAEILRRAREMNRPQTHPDFDGIHCIDCDIEIPPLRRAATGSIRCVDCQGQHEKNAKRF